MAIENLNTVILNLYSGNKGYSLAFRQESIPDGAGDLDGSKNMFTGRIVSSFFFLLFAFHFAYVCRFYRMFLFHRKILQKSKSRIYCNEGGTINVVEKEDILMETKRWPYECCDLLESINNEELPILYMKLISTYAPNSFYSGCIVMEIRDYRQSYPIADCCDSYFVLLRPTTQTILADLNNLSCSEELTHVDRLMLESQMVLVSSRPVCVDPCPKIGIKSIYFKSVQELWNEPEIRRSMRQYSQVAINRREKINQFTRSYRPELMEYLSRHKERLADSSDPDRVVWQIPGRLSRTVRPIETANHEFPDMEPPKDVNVVEYAKRLGIRQENTRDCSPNLIKEYIFETMRKDLTVYDLKLSIYHRVTMEEYLGRIWLNESSYSEESAHGIMLAPFFKIGTITGVSSYVNQLTEIISEEGRRPIKVTCIKRGEEPVIKIIGGMYLVAHTASYCQIS